MAITYTWKITSLKTKTENGNEGAVVQTYWTKTGVDEDNHEGTFSGATPFSSLNMPAGSTFIPFQDLTEEIVLGWIRAVVIGGYEEHVNAQIQKQIDEKHNPITETQMPWAPVAETAAPTTPTP
jgi:hypothetical protein